MLTDKHKKYLYAGIGSLIGITAAVGAGFFSSIGSAGESNRRIANSWNNACYINKRNLTEACAEYSVFDDKQYTANPNVLLFGMIGLVSSGLLLAMLFLYKAGSHAERERILQGNEQNASHRNNTL